jgi:hypothetical protein
MPWRIKRIWVELILGVIALTIAIVVLVLNRDTSTDLLAALGIVGGMAIIINALPTNGNGDDH